MNRFLALALGASLLAPALARAAEQPAVARGDQVFQYWCSNCHGTGNGKPGTVALQAKYKGTPPALLEARTDLSPELVKVYVRNGISIMPFFRKTEIGDADLDALAAYLARNNK